MHKQLTEYQAQQPIDYDAHRESEMYSKFPKNQPVNQEWKDEWK